MSDLTFYQKLIVIALFAAAIFFGSFHLMESPPFNADEGYYMQNASNLVTTGIEGLQMAPGYINHLSTTNSSGFSFIYTLALWFKIFGIGILQGRAFMVALTLGFVILSFLFTRRLFGNNVAIAVMVLVVTFPPLYGNGKAIMGEMPGMFFMILTLYLYSFTRTRPSKKAFWIFLTGISAGLFIATKVAFILFIPSLALAALIEWRNKRLTTGQILLAGGSVTLPLIVWLLLKFQPGDTLQTVIGFYINPSHVSSLTATVSSNIRSLFTSVGPLYMVGMIGLWIVSLALRYRNKSQVTFEEKAAFVFAILSVISFTRTAGFYRYLFPAQIAALVFFPETIRVILSAVSGKFNLAKKQYIYWSAIIILSIFGLYQLCFDSYVADSYSSHAQAEIQSYFDSIPATTSVFFYNSEGLVPFLHSTNYYQHLMFFNQEDWTEGDEFLSMIKNGRVDVVVSGMRSGKDEKAGIFRLYGPVKQFGKVTILKRR